MDIGSLDSLVYAIYFSSIANDAILLMYFTFEVRVRSWVQPVLSNKGKGYCPGYNQY